MIEKNFDSNRLYDKVLRYYLRKRNYTKEQANFIAQRVVQKEKDVRTCKNTKCGHMLHDHLRNYESCLVDNCGCRGFLRAC